MKFSYTHPIIVSVSVFDPEPDPDPDPVSDFCSERDRLGIGFGIVGPQRVRVSELRRCDSVRMDRCLLRSGHGLRPRATELIIGPRLDFMDTESGTLDHIRSVPHDPSQQGAGFIRCPLASLAARRTWSRPSPPRPLSLPKHPSDRILHHARV